MPDGSLPMMKNVHGNTVDYLGSAIVAGRFGDDGALPPEPLLCEELGVSRTVVREAVKSLVAKRLIHTGPKVGTRVMPRSEWNWFDADVIAWQAHAGLTPEFISDLQDLRLIVEPAAVRLAAARRTEADIAQIEDAYAGMARAVKGEPGWDYVPHDLRFHQGLLQAAHNRILMQMSHTLSALLRTSFEISTSRKNGPRNSMPLHRAVLDAIIAQDPRQAEHAVHVLIDGAHHDIAMVLKSQRSLPRLREQRPPSRRAA